MSLEMENNIKFLAPWIPPFTPLLGPLCPQLLTLPTHSSSRTGWLPASPPNPPQQPPHPTTPVLASSSLLLVASTAGNQLSTQGLNLSDRFGVLNTITGLWHLPISMCVEMPHGEAPGHSEPRVMSRPDQNLQADRLWSLSGPGAGTDPTCYTCPKACPDPHFSRTCITHTETKPHF